MTVKLCCILFSITFCPRNSHETFSKNYFKVELFIVRILIHLNFRGVRVYALKRIGRWWHKECTSQQRTCIKAVNASYSFCSFFFSVLLSAFISGEIWPSSAAGQRTSQRQIPLTTEIVAWSRLKLPRNMCFVWLNSLKQSKRFLLHLWKKLKA